MIAPLNFVFVTFRVNIVIFDSSPFKIKSFDQDKNKKVASAVIEPCEIARSLIKAKQQLNYNVIFLNILNSIIRLLDPVGLVFPYSVHIHRQICIETNSSFRLLLASGDNVIKYFTIVRSYF